MSSGSTKTVSGKPGAVQLRHSGPIRPQDVGNAVALKPHYLAPASGTCQQLWDTRELHLVSLDYGGETREVGAIDVNIDQDLVA